MTIKVKKISNGFIVEHSDKEQHCASATDIYNMLCHDLIQDIFVETHDMVDKTEKWFTAEAVTPTEIIIKT